MTTLTEGTLRPVRGNERGREGAERGGKGCPLVISNLNQRYLERCMFDCVRAHVCVFVNV